MNEWIKIRDELPDVDDVVIIHKKQLRQVILAIHLGYGRFRTEHDFNIKALHWMRLPDPPCPKCAKEPEK